MIFFLMRIIKCKYNYIRQYIISSKFTLMLQEIKCIGNQN